VRHGLERGLGSMQGVMLTRGTGRTRGANAAPTAPVDRW